MTIEDTVWWQRFMVVGAVLNFGWFVDHHTPWNVIGAAICAAMAIPTRKPSRTPEEER